MNYFVLVERNTRQSPWAISFGDYDKGVVKFERQDMIDSGSLACNVKVIRSGDLQSDIDQAVSNLNKGI